MQGVQGGWCSDSKLRPLLLTLALCVYYYTDDAIMSGTHPSSSSSTRSKTKRSAASNAAARAMDVPPRRPRTRAETSQSRTRSGDKPRSSSLHCLSRTGSSATSTRRRRESVPVCSGCGRTTYFQFQKLPTDCKLKVFSYLSPLERGVGSAVCKEWNSLMKTSSLWDTVDLTIFPLCTNRKSGHNCTKTCYQLYCKRVQKFLAFLHKVRPAMKRFHFEYDIAENNEGWLSAIETLLHKSNCHELECAHLNWKETPIRPFWIEQVAWSMDDYQEFMQKHRRRQRLFVNLFDTITAMAPGISRLVVPFDWSQRSIKSLSRLRRLHTLVLEKYFVFQSLGQVSVDHLLRELPQLRKLILEVWTPSGPGLMLYKMKSPNIQHLDITQCRGFYLGQVELPSLKVFLAHRHPWNGPLVSTDSLYIRCIHEVLAEGAPNLQQINGHVLQDGWRQFLYPALDDLLKTVCACTNHKGGWAM